MRASLPLPLPVQRLCANPRGTQAKVSGIHRVQCRQRKCPRSKVCVPRVPTRCDKRAHRSASTQRRCCIRRKVAKGGRTFKPRRHRSRRSHAFRRQAARAFPLTSLDNHQAESVSYDVIPCFCVSVRTCLRLQQAFVDDTGWRSGRDSDCLYSRHIR